MISNYTYTAVKADNWIVGFGSVVSKVLPDFYREYYISSGICCPSRTYNDNGTCVFIDITGCKEGHLDAGTLKCDTCELLSKEPAGDSLSCIATSETTYTSNTYTVQNYHFYDQIAE